MQSMEDFSGYDSPTFTASERKSTFEDELKNLVFMKLMDSWLIEDPLTEELCQDILSCINQTLHSMGFYDEDYTVIIPIIYSDRFVKKFGRINREQLFHLLMIATITTVKFWHDTGSSFEKLSYISGTSKLELVAMEKYFLKSMDYDLNLTQEEVERFQKAISL